MKQRLSLLLSLLYCTLSQDIFLKPAIAQVIPDRTTNTTVDVNENNFTINQGDRAGSNLFHSFSDFSVPTNGAAFFNNAADIVNIFSRVTGGNISNIDGLLGANGTANLFLINPAGIIFGEGARLNIGGSFFGSTAEGITFPDGEFNATELDNPPLITINAPIGLNFRDNPAAITNQSVAKNSIGEVVGLEVTPGKNLTLVGGELNFETGKITARGGDIELGGLSAAGTVTFNNNGSLSWSEDVAQADVNLTNASNVDVSGTGGGSITINARNLNLEAGDFGSSFIRAGITADSTSAETQAGDISINVTDNVTVDGSSIINSVNPGAVGDAGDVTITTGSLSLINGGQVDASSFGQGNAGSVEITATDTIIIDGEDLDGIPSAVNSLVNSEAVGDGGNVTITTGSFSLINGGQVDANNFGQGNAGSVEITATDTIIIEDENSVGDAGNLRGGANGAPNQVTPRVVGGAGNIIFQTFPIFPITIDFPNSNSLIPAFIIPSDTKIPMNLIESEQTFALACQSDRSFDKLSGLTIKGKGTIPPGPTEPFDSDILLLDKQTTDIKPIKTSMGDIYPARGIIKTEDGKIILTTYPTDQIKTRTPHIALNCGFNP